jgi:hypothetical protein
LEDGNFGQQIKKSMHRHSASELDVSFFSSSLGSAEAAPLAFGTVPATGMTATGATSGIIFIVLNAGDVRE